MTPDDLAAAIGTGVAELGQVLPDGAAEKMAWLISELQRWSARFNLTAISEPGAMVPGHILDSLTVRPFLAGTRLIDVGTGAGFPGLPLAIAEPQHYVELLDSNHRKIAFVRHIIGELGLANASAVQARAEDYEPGKRFDTVAARALSGTARCVELAGHLVNDNGVLLVQKGKHPEAELRQLAGLTDSWEYSVTELTVPGLPGHSRHVVSLRRRGAERK